VEQCGKQAGEHAEGAPHQRIEQGNGDKTLENLRQQHRERSKAYELG
jgi:hypothetical protein